MSLVCSKCGRVVSRNFSEESPISTQKVNVNITNLSQENDADIILEDKSIRNRIVAARNLFEQTNLVVTGGMLKDGNSKEKYTCNSNKISVSSITNRFIKFHRQK